MNGYTTEDLIEDELPHIALVKPTIVTVLIGANDLVQGSPDGRYRDQLARIYSRIRADASEARVFALPQPDWSLSPSAAGFGDPIAIARAIERFNQIAREQAERAGARWIDLFPLMREQGRRRMFAADGLHPSAEAYAEWAKALEPAI